MSDGARLWGGRFEEGPAKAFDRLNASLPVDRRMWRQDIEGSLAHGAMLASQGIIPAEDGQAIADGLARVAKEFENESFEFAPGDEDIHTAVERRLTELVGDPGRRLHTGRSRNDQVITDTLLYLRERLGIQSELLIQMGEALLSQAEANLDTIIPGYTHLQRAQPVRLAHHLLAYFRMLERDRVRLVAVRASTDESPLGSGALAGVGFPIDRGMAAEALGFDGVTTNSMEAVGGRDQLAAYLHFGAQLGVHLSRLGAEFVWWASEEAGFVDVDDTFASGSSMLPQKKNPDAAELARAKAPRLLANYAGLNGVMAGLPLAYNKDLQEDKTFLFDTVDTVELLLPAMSGMVATARFRPEATRAACEGGFLAATDLADFLVRDEGWPFRKAHEAVGALVKACEAAGVGLDGAGGGELAAAGLDGLDLPALDAEACIETKDVHGGTARARVEAALAASRERLQEW